MRRRFGQTLRIGVSAQAVALVACSRWRRLDAVVLAEQPCADAAPDTIAATIDQLLREAGCAGWPATFVLADPLARIWDVTPPANAARLADLQAACAFRFQHLYGESPAHWQIAADIDAAAPFLAAALPRQLLACLGQCAAAHRLKVLEIAPQFVVARNRWRKEVKPGAWFGLAHEGVLTLGAGTTLRALAVPPDADAAWPMQQARREALRLNIDPPARLAVAGAVPAGWHASDAVAVLGTQGEWSGAVRLAMTGGSA